MANLLNFTLRLENLLSPEVAKAIELVERLGTKVETPHKLHVDTAEAKGGLEGIKRVVEGLGLAFGAYEAVEFLKESVKKFHEADQAGAQFDATLKSTGNTVGITRGELLKMSDDLSKKSLFDDDAITATQSVLLGFTSIKGRIYKEALPAIVDLSTKMGGDLQGATVRLGNALNDPIKGMAALHRNGVQFNATQKASIQHYVATNQLAKAQMVIIKEVNTEFGGSAAAAAKAGGGPMIVLKNQFDNVRESIGGLITAGTNGLVPMAIKLTAGLQGMVDGLKEAPAWMEKNRTSLIAAGVALAALSAEALLFTGIQKAQSLWTTIVTAGQWALNVAMSANPIGLVVAAVAALIAGLAYLYKNNETVRASLDGLAAGVKSAFLTIFESAKEILGGVGHLIKGIFTFDKEELKQGLAAMADGGQMAGTAFDKAKTAAMKASVKSIVNFRTEKATEEAEKKNKSRDLLGETTKPAKIAPLLPDSKAGAVGGSAGGGERVTNITLRIDTLMREVKLSGATMGESVKDLASLIRDTVIAELNDVNTLAAN